MRRGHEHKIVETFAVHRDGRKIERLSENLPIYIVGKALSERTGADVLGSKQEFVEILPGARVVVVIRSYLNLGQRNERDEANQD